MERHDEALRRTHWRTVGILLAIEALLVAVPAIGLLAGAVPGARHGMLLVRRAHDPALFWFAWCAWAALAIAGAWMVLRVARDDGARGRTRPD